MKLNLRIKDKIFIFIVGLGLLFLVVNHFYPKQIENEERIVKEIKDDVIDENKQMDNLNQENQKKLSLQAKILVANNSLEASVAETDLARYQGLSNKDSLGEDKGMLFLFNSYGNHVFAMRDMNFDLDFIFIYDDEVVDLRKNIRKDFSEKIFSPRKYNKVIEVGKGWSEEKGILIGDKIEIIYF